MVDKIWYNMEELIGGSEERVLIETYWNVKRLLDSRKLHQGNVLIETYWNVKREASRVPACFTVVLIETYWNVKVEYNQMIMRTMGRINRNILECKDHY